MNLSDLRSDAKLYAKQHPMTWFYLKWFALYAAILVAAIVLNARILASTTRVRADIQAIRGRLAAMPEANLSGEERDRLMYRIQENAELEARQFLTPPDIPTVLSTISTEAGSNGVSLKKINTLVAEEIPGYSYARIPIAMEVEGEYTKVGDFLLSMKTKVPWDFIYEKARMTPSSDRRPGNVQLELRVAFFSRKS